jgi:hypothetical protein
VTLRLLMIEILTDSLTHSVLEFMAFHFNLILLLSHKINIYRLPTFIIIIKNDSSEFLLLRSFKLCLPDLFFSSFYVSAGYFHNHHSYSHPCELLLNIFKEILDIFFGKLNSRVIIHVSILLTYLFNSHF